MSRTLTPTQRELLDQVRKELQPALDAHQKFGRGRKRGAKQLDLTGRDLRGITLDGEDLSLSILREAKLAGARLIGTDLSDADLRGADLRDADLSQALLLRADARGARFGNATLNHAYCSKANFEGADFDGALLNHADLRDADLGETNLTYADFSGADLRGAEFCDARVNFSRRFLAASSGSGYTMLLVDQGSFGVSVHCGCRHFFSLEEARAHWSSSNWDFDRHRKAHLKDAKAALDYLYKMAKRRGWKVE